MLEASSIANMALGVALPGLAHVLSQPLGRLHLSHGLATGIMLPYTMEFNLPVAAHKMAPVARLLGDEGSDRELAEALLERLWELMDEVGFPTCLDPDVVTEDELPVLVEQCTKVVNYRLNLRNAPPADLEQLYRRALARGVTRCLTHLLSADCGAGSSSSTSAPASSTRRRSTPTRPSSSWAAAASAPTISSSCCRRAPTRWGRRTR